MMLHWRDRWFHASHPGGLALLSTLNSLSDSLHTNSCLIAQSSPRGDYSKVMELSWYAYVDLREHTHTHTLTDETRLHNVSNSTHKKYVITLGFFSGLLRPSGCWQEQIVEGFLIDRVWPHTDSPTWAKNRSDSLTSWKVDVNPLRLVVWQTPLAHLCIYPLELYTRHLKSLTFFISFFRIYRSITAI